MKIKRLIIFTFLLLSVVTVSNAFALTTGIPTFYFDNQEGLVETHGCSLSPVESQTFRISTYSGNDHKKQIENLRNLNGVRQSHLINGSLVKLINGTHKSDYKKVEVIGVNNVSDISPNRWFSERLDQGYLYYSSMLPAEDYVLKLNKETMPMKMGSLRNNVEGLYLKLALESNFFKLNCGNFGNREYIIFKAYEKYASKPMALIAVYWDETKIFKHITTMTKYQAAKILPNHLEEEPIQNYFEADHYSPQLSDSQDISIENDINIAAIITQEGIDNIICLRKKKLNVRNSSLNTILYQAKLGERIKVFQGWGEHTKVKNINGTDYTFKKVQFSDREEKDQMIGWIAASFIKPKRKCKYLRTDIKDEEEMTSQETNAEITGINDPNCCEFPTVKRPTHRYDSGMRKFGAGRSNGTRLHAACDLYRYKDEPILSVAPGKIIRDRYYFYQGTYALEVKHSGGFIVRYGELDKKAIEGMSKGKLLKMGQRLGYMGKVNSDCCRPMLHFELFEGSKTGSLSQRGTKYQRRSDLMDPTTYLHKWENDNF